MAQIWDEQNPTYCAIDFSLLTFHVPVQETDKIYRDISIPGRVFLIIGQLVVWSVVWSLTFQLWIHGILNHKRAKHGLTILMTWMWKLISSRAGWSQTLKVLPGSCIPRKRCLIYHQSNWKIKLIYRIYQSAVRSRGYLNAYFLYILIRSSKTKWLETLYTVEHRTAYIIAFMHFVAAVHYW